MPVTELYITFNDTEHWCIRLTCLSTESTLRASYMNDAQRFREIFNSSPSGASVMT